MTKDTSDVVARLNGEADERDRAPDYHEVTITLLMREAAALISSLVAERDDWQDQANRQQIRAVAAERLLAEARAERDLLQEILDGRPAINAALPASYIQWSQAIYAGDFARASIGGGNG